MNEPLFAHEQKVRSKADAACPDVITRPGLALPYGGACHKPPYGNGGRPPGHTDGSKEATDPGHAVRL